MNQNQTSENQIQKEIEKLDQTNKKQEQRIRNLETKATQNVNLYFIFQAVILASTTATSSSKTSCHDWWIPFTLSLLAAATNLISLCAAISKVLNSREELDQNITDLAFMNMYQLTRTQLIQVLPGTPLNHHGGEIIRPKVGSMNRWKRRLLAYVSVGLFIGFSAVLMYGCYRILCTPGETKCVKLC